MGAATNTMQDGEESPRDSGVPVDPPENAPIGILILAEGLLADLNSAAVATLGYDNKDELVGKSLGELAPATQPDGSNSIDAAAQLAEQALQGPLSFEWVQQTKAGEPLWVQINAEPMVGDGNRLMAVCSDMSERKRSASELGSVNPMFDAFCDRLPVGIYIKNQNLEHVYVNPEGLKIAGAESVEEILGKRSSDLFPAEVAAQMDITDRQLLDPEGINELFQDVVPWGRGSQLFLKNYKFLLDGDDGQKMIGGIAVDVSDLLDSEARARAALQSVIEVLSIATAQRDPYTADHEKRVTNLVRGVGKRLALSDDQMEGLIIAAEIHDVGKANIPVDILLKPGPLSYLEFELVKEHSVAGYELIKDVAFLQPVAMIVRQHHERIDGSGYPDGLVGDDILLEARVLAVCDALEAMTSHRPFRPAFPVERAIEELRNGRGTSYDASIVDTCIDLTTSGELSFEPSIRWTSSRVCYTRSRAQCRG